MPRESRYALRLPPELYELVKSESEKADKSMNEYIVFILGDYHNLKSNIERRLSAIEAKIQQEQSTNIQA